MYRSRRCRGAWPCGADRRSLVIVSGIAVLFDVIEPDSSPQIIAVVPEFVWELALGIYLTVKGFKPAPIISGITGPAGLGAGSSAA
jgi:hypothetical protein